MRTELITGASTSDTSVVARQPQIRTSRGPAVRRPAGHWTSRRKSFRIEAPCDNSCDNSWPKGRIHGHSRSVNGRHARSTGDTKPQVREYLTCGGSGGQGRGRTADLPIFRETVQSELRYGWIQLQQPHAPRGQHASGTLASQLLGAVQQKASDPPETSLKYPAGLYSPAPCGLSSGLIRLRP